MIISRTPYRISFFGGGTDYHTWYQEHGGAVLSTTINHHCYLHCRFMPPFFNHKYRIIWKRIEEIKTTDEIEHPAVREVLKYLKIKRGLEIQHQGDLPARSGLGSSSSFTVGLLNAMYALRGQMSEKRYLASEAVHIERDILGEAVGVQDQIAASYGGFNKITVSPNGNFSVTPITVSQSKITDLQNHMLLFFTGISRTASDIAKSQMSGKTARDKSKELRAMQQMVDEAVNILHSQTNLDEFGKLLHESWALKRSLTSKIAPDFVDEIYKKAKDAGAIGGKLLGAGGGGFMLFFARPEDHPKILEALSDLLLVPFEFENSGSQIIFYEPSLYSRNSMLKRDFMHLQQTNNISQYAKEISQDNEEIPKIKRKSKFAIVNP